MFSLLKFTILDTRQQIERSDPQPDIQSQEIAFERYGKVQVVCILHIRDNFFPMMLRCMLDMRKPSWWYTFIV